MLLRAPSLKDVARDLHALLDYGMTRWQLGDETIAALARQRSNGVLSALSVFGISAL